MPQRIVARPRPEDSRRAEIDQLRAKGGGRTSADRDRLLVLALDEIADLRARLDDREPDRATQ